MLPGRQRAVLGSPGRSHHGRLYRFRFFHPGRSADDLGWTVRHQTRSAGTLGKRYRGHLLVKHGKSPQKRYKIHWEGQRNIVSWTNCDTYKELTRVRLK